MDNNQQLHHFHIRTCKIWTHLEPNEPPNSCGNSSASTLFLPDSSCPLSSLFIDSSCLPTLSFTLSKTSVFSFSRLSELFLDLSRRSVLFLDNVRTSVLFLNWSMLFLVEILWDGGFSTVDMNFLRCFMYSGKSSKSPWFPPSIHKGSYFCLHNSHSFFPWEQSTISSDVPWAKKIASTSQKYNLLNEILL